MTCTDSLGGKCFYLKNKLKSLSVSLFLSLFLSLTHTNTHTHTHTHTHPPTQPHNTHTHTHTHANIHPGRPLSSEPHCCRSNERNTVSSGADADDESSVKRHGGPKQCAVLAVPLEAGEMGHSNSGTDTSKTQRVPAPPQATVSLRRAVHTHTHTEASSFSPQAL